VVPAPQAIGVHSPRCLFCKIKTHTTHTQNSQNASSSSYVYPLACLLLVKFVVASTCGCVTFGWLVGWFVFGCGGFSVLTALENSRLKIGCNSSYRGQSGHCTARIDRAMRTRCSAGSATMVHQWTDRLAACRKAYCFNANQGFS
jgi:hypothetical protein